MMNEAATNKIKRRHNTSKGNPIKNLCVPGKILCKHSLLSLVHAAVTSIESFETVTFYSVETL